MKRSRLVLGAALIVSTGCAALGPDYERPELATPLAYAVGNDAPVAGGSPAPAADLDWWKGFGDPALDGLIDRALVGNADLRIALARVDEARALAGVAGAQRFPEIGVAAGSRRDHLSQKAGDVAPGGEDEFERHQVALTFGWEIDVWGRLRRLTRAAEADLLATEYGAAAARTSIAAAVAQAYFDLRTLEEQLAIARDTLTSRGEALDLQNLRLDSGVISEFEVSQARAERSATSATVPQLEQLVQETRSRLGILVGDPAAGRAVVLARDRSDDGGMKVPPEVPVGLPSELLTRRPDVAAAEQGLVAAQARVGVAKAAYFPTLSLTAAGGSASAEFADLLTSRSSIWNVAANLVGPLFNAGATGRRVAAARAREVQAFESYRQAMSIAFADVEDALSARRTTARRREALIEQAQALNDAFGLAQVRYDAGSSSYFEVLDAQRSLFRAQLDLAAARNDEARAAVRLFAALGGGFTAAGPGDPGSR
jgi:multidrug efflux system outer membrane protein